MLADRGYHSNQTGSVLRTRYGSSAQFTVGRVRGSLVRVLAGTSYRSNNVCSVPGKMCCGCVLLTVGCVRFNPIRLVQRRRPLLPVDATRSTLRRSAVC